MFKSKTLKSDILISFDLSIKGYEFNILPRMTILFFSTNHWHLKMGFLIFSFEISKVKIEKDKFEPYQELIDKILSVERED